MRKSALILWSILLMAAIGVIWMGNHFGQWYFTFLVALMAGLWGKPGFMTWLGTWITGILGWGIPLWMESWHSPLVSTAAAATAAMGFGHHAFVALILTFVVAFLLATVGVWLGTALRDWRLRALEN